MGGLGRKRDNLTIVAQVLDGLLIHAPAIEKYYGGVHEFIRRLLSCTDAGCEWLSD